MPRRGDPSGRAFTSVLLPTFRLSRLFSETINETSRQLKANTFQWLMATFSRKKVLHLTKIHSATQYHLNSPVIQVRTLGPVQGVRGDAATSCNAPGTSNYGQTRTLSQAVDHRLGQLRLLHHVLDLLQLLVIGSPPGSCGGGGGGLHCTSYSTCRAWIHWTEQWFPKL